MAVATQALGALPDAATAPWRGNLGLALDRRRAADEADPERAALASRFDERDAMAPVPGLAPADDPGDATTAFAAAVRAFASAAAIGDAAGSADAGARVAQAACDVADPFQTTPLERPEVAGARARFCDVLGPAALALGAVGNATLRPAETRNAALAVARASAVLRDSAESLVRSGDDRGLVALQRARLDAAAALAGAALAGAWRDAALTVPMTRTLSLRVTPGIVRESAALTFVAPRAGTARLELFDLAGRRVSGGDLGRVTPGVHTLAIDRERLGAPAAGVYFARLTVDGMTGSTRMVIAAR